MIKNKAVIEIKGEQTVQGETDLTELSVVGTIERTETGYEIEYFDYDSVKQTRNLISIADNGTVMMMKFGEVTAEMLFDTNTRQNCDYQTPYGNINIGIYTFMLEKDFNENGGTVKIGYNIDFNTGLAAENILTISASLKN